MDNLITILAPYAELLVGISLLSFIGSLLLVPILIIRIPADYFSHNRRPPLESSHPIINNAHNPGPGLANITGGHGYYELPGEIPAGTLAGNAFSSVTCHELDSQTLQPPTPGNIRLAAG